MKRVIHSRPLDGLPHDPIKDCPNDCIYRVRAGSIESCDYILAHYERRGCKGGRDCERYEKGKASEREEWTERKLRFT